jgi:hypothetical protein
LKVFARVAQPIHELELVGLVPREAGGVYATLRVRGTLILGDDLEFASPDAAHVIVALDALGGVRGAWAITGGEAPTILGDDLTGQLMWSSSCLPCTVTDLVGEARIQPPTEVERPAILVHAQAGGRLVATPVSHPPLAKDALDQTYMRVAVMGAEEVVVRGAGTYSVTLSSPDAAASAWLVRLSNTLTPQVLGGVYFTPTNATLFPEFDVDAGPVRVMGDGRVLFPFFVAPGRLSSSTSGSTVEIGSNSLIVAIHRPNFGVSLTPVISQLANPLGFGPFGYVDAIIEGDELLVAGEFAGREVVFGAPPEPRAYQSSQHWGLEGSGSFGAGQEAFIVRLVGGSTSWLRTLRPLGHPEPWGLPGSASYGFQKSPSGWLLAAHIRGFGAWAGLGPQVVIAPPSSNGSEHAVLAEFSDQGELLWSSSSDASSGDKSLTVLAQSGVEVFLAGRLQPGTNGVGPSRIVDPQLEVPTPRLYIQRVNSAGGLSCGAGP